jgi:transmembrane sensor
MNSRHLPLDPAADEQAALWAARLDGSSLTLSDRQQLEAWLAANAHHRALLTQYCQFSADLESELPEVIARGHIVMPAAKPSTRRHPAWAWFTGMAIAAAAAVVAVGLWPARTTVAPQAIATAIAQRQSLTLADGTRVELNARTTLQVEFNANQRRVQLAEGQAFFTVTKDPARPFVVQTPAGSVQVTGTAFDVRTSASSELQVAVVEGSVLVRPGEQREAPAAEPVALQGGDVLSAQQGTVSVQTLPAEAVQELLAWREGVAVFNAVPLEAALARFAHHHGRGITVLAGAAAHRVSGRYSLDDLDGFVSTLDQFFPVEVTHGLSGTITVAPRKNR